MTGDTRPAVAVPGAACTTRYSNSEVAVGVQPVAPASHEVGLNARLMLQVAPGARVVVPLTQVDPVKRKSVVFACGVVATVVVPAIWS
jgi:hypothetical protein